MPAGEEEAAVARLLELVPSGHELTTVAGGVELAVYVNEAELPPLEAAFPGLAATHIEPGWEDAWRRFHRPVTIGRLWVGPPWETAPEHLLAVVIDPGRAFGTGAHPTTRLCLELLDGLERGSLLDVGCGSGVLAIAAARLGFAPVMAVDVDEDAVAVTRENVAANGVAVDVQALDARHERLPAARVVVANIALDAAAAVASAARCEQLVLSGYLERETVAAAGFVHVDRRTSAEWAADLFRRQ